MVELDIFFSEREWPMATYRGPMNRPAAYFISETPFSKTALAANAYKPITVILVRYNMPGHDPFKGRRMQYEDFKFDTLHNAVTWTRDFLTKNVGWQPLLR
jgi:hypothetical protein